MLWVLLYAFFGFVTSFLVTFFGDEDEDTAVKAFFFWPIYVLIFIPFSAMMLAHWLKEKK